MVMPLRARGAARVALVVTLSLIIAACNGSGSGPSAGPGAGTANTSANAAEALKQPFADALQAIKEAHDRGIEMKFAESAAAFRRYEAAYAKLAEPLGRRDPALRKKLDDRTVELGAEYKKAEPRKGEIDEEGVRIAQLLNDAAKLLQVPVPDVEVKMAFALAPAKPFKKQETIRLEMVEYKIVPAEIAVEKDTKVKLVVANKGKEEHQLEIEGYEIEIGDIEPGRTAEAEFVADRPGKYGLICHKPGHEEAGQRAVLVVK